MSLNCNTVTIGGNLVRDPELRFFANDQCVCNFGIAINERYKDRDGQLQEKAIFVDCEAWNTQGQWIGERLLKGMAVVVEGKLQFDQWTDQEGQKHSKLKVRANRVHVAPGALGAPVTDRAATTRTYRRAEQGRRQAQDQDQGRHADQSQGYMSDDPPF